MAELCEFDNESSVSMQRGNSLINFGTISFLLRSLLCRITSVVKLLSLGHTVNITLRCSAVTLLCNDLTLTARMVIVWSVVFSRERSETGSTRGR